LNTALLNLEGLACERDHRLLFQHLDLTLLQGEILELTGPNGSGKTTLLRCLAGLSSDFEGEIEIGSFLYLGHASGISSLLTARENQHWYASLTGLEVTDSELDTALARVGLDGYQNVPCGQLSAGQKRRVVLSRLLFSQALLWLLDEPLTALDQQGITLIGELMREHSARDGGVLYATHQSLTLPNLRELDLAVHRG